MAQDMVINQRHWQSAYSWERTRWDAHRSQLHPAVPDSETRDAHLHRAAAVITTRDTLACAS